eukprot:161999-Pyramimonas_sp.AAC.1
MAVWTRAIIKRTPCDPQGVIDDSSLQHSSNDRNQVVEAIIRSLDQFELFGSVTGCSLNKGKTKLLANTVALRKLLNAKFHEVNVSCARAIALVGGILSDGTMESQAARNALLAKRIAKLHRVLDRVDRGPGSFEWRDRFIATYGGAVGFYVSELQLPNATETNHLSSRIRRIFLNGKAMCRSRFSTATLSSHGHSLDPRQAR